MFSKLRFSRFKKVVFRSVLGKLKLTQILIFQTTCCNLKVRGLGTKVCVAFISFLFWKELWHFKVKSPFFCWTKIQTLIKTRRNQKWKIPHTVLERWTLCFRSYKDWVLKVKLWWVGAHERKKRAFFVTFTLSDWNFFNICVLCQWTVYWINFLNICIHTFTYQKTLLRTLLLLVYKIVESLQCILKWI